MILNIVRYRKTVGISLMLPFLLFLFFADVYFHHEWIELVLGINLLLNFFIGVYLMIKEKKGPDKVGW